MEMIVHLHPEIFDIVLQGTKDVEIRVNDEKRRALKVGDTLIFVKRPGEQEKLKTTVKNLVYFSSFEEVLDAYDMERFYLEGTSHEEYLQLMKQFYSEEEVDKNGIVAIEFEQVMES